MIAEYSFLPWLRRGIANEIKTDPGASSRASITVKATIEGESGESVDATKVVQLVGPADIVGIVRNMIVRTEPRNLVTDFEPNFLPFIEFYDEDFPWRYTPEAPTADHKLKPWLTLIVLKEEEFERRNSPTTPLPGIFVKKPAVDVFPNEDEVWAWAHVHLNGKLNNTTNKPDLDHLNSILDRDPDKGLSRLLCPRRLEENKPYFAFLVPTFEVGRLAGLGSEVNGSATKVAWNGELLLPVYFEWFFRTGVGGDFEELVRLLVPRDIDERVGIRDMDIQHPGFGIPFTNTTSNGIVGLEGALLAPTSKRRPEDFDKVSEFPENIETIINRQDDLQTVAMDSDPLITPPLYGRWHAMVKRLSRNPAELNWVNELNLDARTRVASGFGTRVIIKNQETYMRASWQQIGDVIPANDRIKFSQWAMLTSHLLFIRNLKPMKPVNVLPILSGTFPKVMGSPVTIHYLHRESSTPRAVMSGTVRKWLRPRGAANKRFFPLSPVSNNLGEMITQVNNGTITAADPKTAPETPTQDDLLTKLNYPTSSHWFVRNIWWLLLALLVVLILLVAFIPGVLGLGAATAIAAAGVYMYVQSQKIKQNIEHNIAAVDALAPSKQSPAAVDAIPAHPDFELLEMKDIPAARIATGDTDNETSAKFKIALKDYFEMTSARTPQPTPRPQFDLEHAHDRVMETIAPLHSFPKRVSALLKIGDLKYRDYLYDKLGIAEPDDSLTKVMAYPDIKTPMYEPLVDIDSELMVPNLKLVPPNTISLMKTNQRFIESYMIGLNHEFARELLWREYPTDQQGSVFRQFWDPSGFVNRDNLSEKDFAELIRDIKPIHKWGKNSKLGTHNNRESGDDESQVVLVIRGELLKRYPNTVIYAQRAKWSTDPASPNQLVLWDETGEITEVNNTDRENIQYPLYSAKVPPDLHFIGFDLTLDEVRGDPGLKQDRQSRENIDPKKIGWYFVIKERPGEVRFGMDTKTAAEPSTKKWDNMSWDQLKPGVKVINFKDPAPDPDGQDDANVNWGSNAADMAYILYQKPVLVAVHGSDMLKNLTTKK